MPPWSNTTDGKNMVPNLESYYMIAIRYQIYLFDNQIRTMKDRKNLFKNYTSPLTGNYTGAEEPKMEVKELFKDIWSLALTN